MKPSVLEGIKPQCLTKDERRAICKKLWMLFRNNDTHDDIREYEAMATALMSEYGVRFENYAYLGADLGHDGDVREWFFSEINTVSVSDNFKEFYGICTTAFDWTCSYNPFTLNTK